MGYQQSFIQFDSKEDLVEQLQKYAERNTEQDVIGVYGVVKCVNGINEHGIRKGSYLAVIGGERYAQRDTEILREEIGFDKVREIYFIDNLVWEVSDSRAYLDYHFHQLKKEEIEELGIKFGSSKEEGEE